MPIMQAWGGGATLQDGLSEEINSVNISFKFEGNSSFYQTELVHVDVSIQYGDETKTISDITGNRTISNVSSGSVITIKITEGSGYWGKEIRYFGINEGGKEYSLGLASGESGDVIYWNTFTLEITENTEFILKCTNNRLYNPITIINNSDVDLFLFGKIRVNNETKPMTIEPGQSLKIWGNLSYDNNSWFRVEFDSSGKIPVINFVDTSFLPDVEYKHSIGECFFETLFNNSEKPIVFDLIDKSELVVFPDRTLIEGESYPITVSDKLKNTVDEGDPSSNEASLNWTSTNENVATVDNDGKLHCHSHGECKIFLTLKYDNKFDPETSFPLGTPIEFNVIVHETYSITINNPENGNVTADRSTAIGGQVINLTVHPIEGYILDSISTVPELELIPTENGYAFTMPNEDVIVTPTFVPASHTVTFHNESVSWEESFSHRAPLIFPEDPTKESDPQWDYMFAGWVDSGKNEVSEGTLITDDLHLYATYTKTERLYNIDFVVNGIIFKHFNMAYNDVIIPPADPYVEGYDFVGWCGYTPGMIVVDDMEFNAVLVESSEPMPPWHGDNDSSYIPPNIVVEKSEDDDCLWIFIVLGSVATFIFLLFAYFERRDREE